MFLSFCSVLPPPFCLLHHLQSAVVPLSRRMICKMWPWICLFGSALGVEVTTPLGSLRGISEGPHGEVHAFRGIPYAQPPVKTLRWRPPRPLEPWAPRVLDASSYGNSCINHCASSDWKDYSTVGGDEDCLYLNVYAPREVTEKLPCLVWIHGGSYEFGSSNEYNASNLVSFWRSQQSPAIVVTLNHRLNVFGFLGSDQLRDRDPLKSTGNYGLQDQRMALQWVRENIASFGGDPSKVLLFGQSSGASSVSMHLVMPRSYGLYSSALMQSGAFAAWSAQQMVRKEFWFQQLMNQTKCQNVDCLLTLPAEELLLAYMAIPHGHCCDKLAMLGADPELPWAPTIDGVELTAHPWDLLKEGKVNPVPTLIGNTLDDGARFCAVHNLSTEFLTFQANHRTSAAAELYRSESHFVLPGYGDGYWSALRGQIRTTSVQVIWPQSCEFNFSLWLRLGTYCRCHTHCDAFSWPALCLHGFVWRCIFRRATAGCRCGDVLVSLCCFGPAWSNWVLATTVSRKGSFVEVSGGIEGWPSGDWRHLPRCAMLFHHLMA